ncbi:MAG: hypothetical protein AAF502_09570 [Bacteroidota bacterium]
MKNKTLPLTLFLVIILSATFYNCTEATFDEAAAKAEILELHHLQKKFHVDKMVDEFANLLADNHISVNRGRISAPTREENAKRFSSYFSAVEFEKWDDLKPPVIRFSDDGSMAYTIVNKEVTVTYDGEEDQKVRETVEYSWVAIYKKYPDGWKIDCVASTNLEPQQEIL